MNSDITLKEQVQEFTKIASFLLERDKMLAPVAVFSDGVGGNTILPMTFSTKEEKYAMWALCGEYVKSHPEIKYAVFINETYMLHAKKERFEVPNDIKNHPDRFEAIFVIGISEAETYGTYVQFTKKENKIHLEKPEQMTTDSLGGELPKHIRNGFKLRGTATEVIKKL